MDINTTAPYVFTRDTILADVVSRKQPFESKDPCKTLRQDLISRYAYCGLSVVDSGINGYDFPKERKYYVAAAVNREAPKNTAPVTSTEPSWDDTLYL